MGVSKLKLRREAHCPREAHQKESSGGNGTSLDLFPEIPLHVRTAADPRIQIGSINNPVRYHEPLKVL